MELGMIGLGKMGGFMTERLIQGGHKVVGYWRTRSKDGSGQITIRQCNSIAQAN